MSRGPRFYRIVFLQNGVRRVEVLSQSNTRRAAEQHAWALLRQYLFGRVGDFEPAVWPEGVRRHWSLFRKGTKFVPEDRRTQWPKCGVKDLRPGVLA